MAKVVQESYANNIQILFEVKNVYKLFCKKLAKIIIIRNLSRNKAEPIFQRVKNRNTIELMCKTF